MNFLFAVNGERYSIFNRKIKCFVEGYNVTELHFSSVTARQLVIRRLSNEATHLSSGKCLCIMSDYFLIKSNDTKQRIHLGSSPNSPYLPRWGLTKIILKVSVTEDVQTMQFHTKISQQNYNRITLVPNRIILSSLHANKE